MMRLAKRTTTVAPSREDASTWVSGLHMLMAEADISEGDPAKLHYNMSTWLRRQFNAADTSNNGTLDLDEVTDLMRKLNIRLSKSEIKSTFKIADVGKFGSLKFAAFERLYRVLRFRPEVSELFSALSRTKPALITYEEFKVFAQQTQKNDWTDERCYEVYSKYAGANSQEMNVDHFSAFLLASTNSIFNKTHNHVFQDMSRPMTDYFINTSHNTYLLKDQLAGESSVEGYIRALQRGCRCVELDCFDGNNGQPVIYHGMTLVGKLLFKDVIEAIGKYAFVATPYPLILSLESQCGPEQQAAMANILREYLGDYLLQRPLVENATSLPSPEDLKNKIIIKGKILASGKSEMEYETEDEEEVLSPGVATSPLAQVSNLVDSGTAPTLVRKPTTRKSRNSQGAEESAEAAAQRKRAGKEEPGLARKKSSPKLSRKHIVAKPLLELLVYCQGVSFESFAAAAELFLFNHMCSLSEKKSIALIQRQRAEYIAFTKRSLTRIYPAGTRVTSTNYDPIPHWAVGAQMVAMNYQTFDKGMQLNTGLFSLNGRCGYVLKPTALRNKAGPKPDPISLTIKIISGQQLPKPKDSTGKTVIDPYVELEIAGGDTDCIKYRTKAINNNGFNPMWKEEFRFNIADPEMALLRFSIFDMDVKMTNDFIGSYTIPIQSLEQGYRHVPVYNWKGDLIRFSTLFIYVRIISVPSTKSSSSTAPPTAALQFGNPLAGTSEPAQLTTAVVGNPVPTTGTTTTQPQQANGLIGTVYAR
ncbi:PLC-like phosphodiesterase [Fimicolochytrium jonesii]|uniref:PLC-like phosphodiesterase n=1 Tax=Fimicolochytrium jonesii TaxID=1396493 RepID=UPI0022FE98C2|nr:PLC-like phosphodiesterase [Fimicolochytrium jonesii]KAI8817538.1 PLC-like phosphodiesterase [Fimicolochytrium jonesii]